MMLSLQSKPGSLQSQSIRLVLAVVLVLSAPLSSSAQLTRGSGADPRGWQPTADGDSAPTAPSAPSAATTAAQADRLRMNQPATLESEPEIWVAPLHSNQPAQINERSSHSLDNHIRRQIGLASFDESLEPVGQNMDELPAGNRPSEKTLSRSQSQSTEASPPAADDQHSIGSVSEPSESKLLLPPTALPLPTDIAGKSDEFPFSSFLSQPAETLTAPSGIQGSLKFALLIGALSLAPAIILMTTCYIRVVVVLSLLKQAFGGQQLPPAQVLTALSLFLTFLIMTPVWNELKKTAIDPYAANEIQWDVAWQRGVAPIKTFMVRQIQLSGNEESVAVFYKYADVGSSLPPSELVDVPLNVLIPAFMISELKVAFLLGFQIYLPFLVLDLIVSSVTVSMGMLMLPPQMVSFPLKLILFVLVDGWNLVIGMLLQSFGALM